MSKLIRFGVSLEDELLVPFDRLLKVKGYENRSEAIRALIREYLVKRQWVEGRETAGAITLVYDHHRRELVRKLTDIQHDFHHMIISTQHIHLDHDNCLEIIAVRGKPRDVEELSDRLKAVKGIKHGTLSLSSTGKEMV